MCLSSLSVFHLYLIWTSFVHRMVPLFLVRGKERNSWSSFTVFAKRTPSKTLFYKSIKTSFFMILCWKNIYGFLIYAQFELNELSVFWGKPCFWSFDQSCSQNFFKPKSSPCSSGPWGLSGPSQLYSFYEDHTMQLFEGCKILEATNWKGQVWCQFLDLFLKRGLHMGSLCRPEQILVWIRSMVLIHEDPKTRCVTIYYLCMYVYLFMCVYVCVYYVW